MLLIKDKLNAIEADLNQLSEAVRQAELAVSHNPLAATKRAGIEQELQDLKDAILDVEAQINRKTCYVS